MEFEKLDPEIEYDIEQEILFDAISEQLDESEECDSKNSFKSQKKSSNSKNKFSNLKNGLKIRTVLLLIITLLANTYAWFVYISQVSASIEMHIKSWDVEFSASDGTTNFVLTADQIYPGMNRGEALTKTINVKNNSTETNGQIICDVKRVKILDEEYSLETAKDDGELYTSQELLDKLKNDYPFTITIEINEDEYTGTSDNVILQDGELTRIVLKVVWPWETGDVEQGIAEGDEEDTLWGNKAYEYMENGGEKYSVQVYVELRVVQYEGEVPGP